MKYLKTTLVLVLVLGGFVYLGDRESKDDRVAEISPSVNQELLEPNILVVESLGIRVPVQYVDAVSESVFQKALQNGVVHYPGTALPGEYGNVYLFGHSSDNAWAKGSYKTIFAPLPQIEIGVEILLTDGSGEIYKYYVTEKIIASPKDIHFLEQGDRTKRILTLQTSYPVGTSLKRYIVRAEMRE